MILPAKRSVLRIGLDHPVGAAAVGGARRPGRRSRQRSGSGDPPHPARAQGALERERRHEGHLARRVELAHLNRAVLHVAEAHPPHVAVAHEDAQTTGLAPAPPHAAQGRGRCSARRRWARASKARGSGGSSGASLHRGLRAEVDDLGPAFAAHDRTRAPPARPRGAPRPARRAAARGPRRGRARGSAGTGPRGRTDPRGQG